MDAQTYFLMLHEHAHFRGKAARVLEEPTPDQWRTMLPGHNSIAWIVWHVARREDWAVTTMLQGTEQLLTRDGWDVSMNIARRDFGAGMTPAEVAELSAVALAAWYREWGHSRSEQQNTRHHGQPAEARTGPGRLLSNRLRTVG